MPEQLGLALPSMTALGRADFMVAPSNAVAVAMIDAWRDWSGRKLVLSGPEGAGKTHLTHVWAALSDARVIEARDLTADAIPALAVGCVAVEDVPLIADQPETQTALFHLHNMVLAEGHSLLLTGRGTAAHWGIGLPDLASRLSGTQSAILEAPDDALLAAVMAKLFADRQIAAPPDLISYLLRRIDRSFAAAHDIVVKLDAASLAQKRPLTRALAGAVLDKDGLAGR